MSYKAGLFLTGSWFVGPQGANGDEDREEGAEQLTGPISPSISQRDTWEGVILYVTLATGPTHQFQFWQWWAWSSGALRKDPNLEGGHGRLLHSPFFLSCLMIELGEVRGVTQLKKLGILLKKLIGDKALTFSPFCFIHSST